MDIINPTLTNRNPIHHPSTKKSNCLSLFEGTEKVPVFEKSCFIQLSISGCRELRQTDSNK